MKIWRCRVCGYIHRGETPPLRCPICNAGASKFEEIDEASIPEKQIKKAQTGVGVKSSQFKSEKAGQNRNPGQSVKSTGVISGSSGDTPTSEKIKALLVKHHLHPISVHTPNGILPVVAVLWIGAWIFGYDTFAKAAFINLIFVIAVLPFVVFTGFLEWQKKYNGALTLIFKIKIAAAAMTCLLSVISFIWYISEPNVLSSSMAWLFILINILMLLSVGIAGHIGGKFVFKD